MEASPDIKHEAEELTSIQLLGKVILQTFNIAAMPMRYSGKFVV